MNKLFNKIAALSVGLAMAIGVGVAVGSQRSDVRSARAAAGDELTYTITATNMGLTTSYITTDTTFTINNDGGSTPMTFAFNQHMTNAAKDQIQSKASSGYLRNTTIPDGYALKSITINNKSGQTARNWTFYGSDDVLTAAPASGGTSSTSGHTFGSGTTYDSTNYPYSYFFAARGANANYATSYVVKVIELSASTAELESITVSGNLTKSAYTTAESWSASGLVATANYDDDSSKTVTNSAEWSFSPATPKAGGAGTYNVRFTATYGGVSGYIDKEVTVTKAIQYELVTDATELTKGSTVLIVGSEKYNNNTYTKAMIASRKTSNGSFGNNADVTLSDGFNSGSVATSANATVFTLGGSAGAWTLSNGDNKLGFTGTSNNNVQFNENMTDTFTITSGSNNIVTINSNTHSGRGLRMNVNQGSPLFSNYGSGNQSPVYLFADIAEVTYGTTDHIDVATLPQTHWHVGQTFSDAGIAINAWDNADETQGNSKVVTTYTTSISGVTSGTAFTDSDIGSHIVTVTFTEGGQNFTDTYSIYVYATATYELVTSEPSGGWSGTYLITSTISDAIQTDKVQNGTYAMRSTGVNLDYVGNYDAVTPVTADGKTTITTGQEFQFSIAAITGGYSIQGKDGKYIGWNKNDANGLTSSDSALVNTITFSEGNASIVCSAGTKGLKLDKSSGQFRYYSSPSVQLYRLVESTEAEDYAEEFLDMLSTGSDPVCQVTEQGVVQTDLDDLKVAWAILAADFNSLSSNAIKQQFTQGTADETSEDKISQALALYDHIARVYGTRLQSEDCADFDFMDRGIVPNSNSRINIFSNEDSTGNTFAIAVVIAVLGVTAVGGYFLLKKKKEQ